MVGKILAVIGSLLLVLAACAPLDSMMPTTTRGLVAVLEGHEGAVSDVSFSPDGTLIASGSTDASVRLWDVATGKKTAIVSGHLDTVFAVAFSPDGELLASVSGLVWAPAPPLRFGEPEASPTSTPYPGVQILGSNGVILWDVATSAMERYWEFGTPMFAATFSPDGRVLATGNGNPAENIHGSVRLWDVSTGELEATLWEGTHATVWSVDFSADGTLLASGNAKGITVWDVVNHERKATLIGEAMGAVVYSPDDLLLASGDSRGVVKLWSTATYQARATLQGHDGAVSDVAFSPDGLVLASAGQDGRVYIWDVETRDKMAVIRIARTRIGATAFSPDGRLLATASSDGMIRLWDVAELLN